MDGHLNPAEIAKRFGVSIKAWACLWRGTQSKNPKATIEVRTHESFKPPLQYVVAFVIWVLEKQSA